MKHGDTDLVAIRKAGGVYYGQRGLFAPSTPTDRGILNVGAFRALGTLMAMALIRRNGRISRIWLQGHFCHFRSQMKRR